MGKAARKRALKLVQPAEGAQPFRLMYIGDFATKTGFSRVNENIIAGLSQDDVQLPIHVLAINYLGDPTPLQGGPLRLYPAGKGGDPYGRPRIAEMIRVLKPDLLVMHQDAWIIADYLDVLEGNGIPIPPSIAWCPPDAKNQKDASRLWKTSQGGPGVDLLLCPTEWGVQQMVESGYEGPTAVVPYGVDLDHYQPADKIEVRKAMGFPEHVLNSFVVGRADRNATRKRYDLTVAGFAKWWHEAGKPNAYLYLHCAPKDIGVDLPNLCEYYGLLADGPRVIFTNPTGKHRAEDMPNEAFMPRLYNAWDVHLSTAMGEGWGLVALESMACGVPQILPRNAAYAEWAAGAALFLDGGEPFVTSGGANTIGDVVSVDAVAKALQAVYRDAALQADLSAKARACAEQFPWDRASAAFADAYRKVMSDVRSARDHG